MAPLTELSVNLPGKTRANNPNGLGTNSSKIRPASLLVDEQPSSLPSTSAIQSMLKNTTELGNIGSYVAKATKLPHQPSGTIGHPREHRLHRPIAPYSSDHPAGHHNSHRRYHQPHYHQFEQSLRHNASLSTHRDHSLASDKQYRRSGSLTPSSSLNSRRISFQPSLRSIRSYGHAASRPPSPRAYPSRLKRPGYRPSSPAASSEFNRSDGVIHATVHRAYSTRTASPLSTSSQRRTPAVWNHAINRSDPLLHHHRTVPMSRKHDGNRSPPFLRYEPLRRSPLGSDRSSVIVKARAPNGSGSSSSGEGARTKTPLFYDYSEAFEKESFHHTAKRSSMFVARPPPQSDGSSEGYQTDMTNTSDTFAKYADSSTASKITTSERAIVKAEYPSSLRPISPGLKQESSERNKETLDTDSESNINHRLPAKFSEDQDVDMQRPHGPKLPSDLAPSFERLLELPPNTSKSIDTSEVSPASHTDLEYPSSAYNPTPKMIKTAALNMRLSSSSSGSQYSTSVNSKHNRMSNPLAIQVPTVAYERQPKALSVSFNHLATFQYGTTDMELQPRAASLDTRLRPDPCQIFSPVPERSMSSRDSRDRFSRIFSAGDDLAKRDLFTNALSNKKASMTIQQYLRDKKSHSPNASPTTTKDLPPLPNDPPAVPDKGKGRETDETLAILSANEHLQGATQVQDKDQGVLAVSVWERLAGLSELPRPGIPPRFSSIARNSLLDRPGPSHFNPDSILSQKSSAEPQPRMFPLTKRNSSLVHAMKELPPLPLEPVSSIAPPKTPSPLELPHRFTPLLPADWLDTVVADIQDSAVIDHTKRSKVVARNGTPDPTFKTASSFEHASTASAASTKPWNLDASYPWGGTPPKLEVSIPRSTEDPAQEVQKLPRFRLKFHRSSTLGTGGKLMKSRPPNIEVRPLPATISTPIQTRFMEGPANVGSAAPSITLVPPSPGLKIEAQSFFSDGSSQKRRKSSLKKGISQLRGMVSRNTSTDEMRGLEKGRSTSALGQSRASKHSSKRSLTIPNDGSRHKGRKWKILGRFKSWFHRYEDRIKVWHSRFGFQKHQSHAFSANV
ncbi:MAG: hypothetical protein Q9169_000688 [Polycauliona sp. 2 TL-2023]